ncbi:unnamed protein product [Didymodactylos carnosus]|uniref:Uncharacterized protein n=1 Tax=Didymodactylos carnosus TaxID=1234261 RepID=A0A814FQT3_9BILA|nr:unnamed protein product [Didymodactylos carnosus]CAF0985422.1 unnamed protein product [Didymodactylos carnosus]CAF3604567.1 unnamed protein product [Didymodactylos carnosus]CAF3757684.1 unnamed protein product [Didymodactylos carnosus]
MVTWHLRGLELFNETYKCSTASMNLVNKDIGKTNSTQVLTANTSPAFQKTSLPSTTTTNLPATTPTTTALGTIPITMETVASVTDPLLKAPVQSISLIAATPMIKKVESDSNLNIMSNNTSIQMETDNQCEKSSIIRSSSLSSNEPLYTKFSSTSSVLRRITLPLEITTVDQAPESNSSDNRISKSTINNRCVISESKPENDDQSIVTTTPNDISKTKPCTTTLKRNSFQRRNVVIADTQPTTTVTQSNQREFVATAKSNRVVVTADPSIKSRITSNKFLASQQNNDEQLRTNVDSANNSGKQSTTPPLNVSDEDSDIDIDDLFIQENKKQGVNVKPILTDASLVDISFPCSVQSNRFSFMTMKQQQPSDTTNEQNKSKPIRLNRERLTAPSTNQSTPSSLSSAITTPQLSGITTNLSSPLSNQAHLEKKESAGILGSNQLQETILSSQKQSIQNDRQKQTSNVHQRSIICSSTRNPSADSMLMKKIDSTNETNNNKTQKTDFSTVCFSPVSSSTSVSAALKDSNHRKRPTIQSPTAAKRFANEVTRLPPTIGDLCLTDLSSSSDTDSNRRYHFHQQQNNRPKSPSHRATKPTMMDTSSVNRPMSSFDWNKETSDFIKNLRKPSPSAVTTNRPIMNHTTVIRPLMQRPHLQHSLENGNIRGQPCVAVKRYNNDNSFKQRSLINKINDVKPTLLTSSTINQCIKPFDPPTEVLSTMKNEEEKQTTPLSLSTKQIDSSPTINNNNNVDLSSVQPTVTSQEQSVPVQINTNDVKTITMPQPVVQSTTVDDFDGLLLNDVDFLDEAFQAADELLLLYKPNI